MQKAAPFGAAFSDLLIADSNLCVLIKEMDL